ncbi:hypothetical protein [Limosilactobacillus fermentum]|uniref:hypothetical protein n=1 Tax=Limosilactobacillus fermentum TaxID=1613 RepID=UPI00301E40E3
MIQDVGLALWLAVAMVVCFLLMILVYRYALKNDAPVAILRAIQFVRKLPRQPPISDQKEPQHHQKVVNGAFLFPEKPFLFLH